MRKIYVGGEWLDSGVYQDVKFPYNDELVDTISVATPKEINLAIEKAEEAFEETKKMTPYQRASVLRHIVAKMTERHEEFSQMLTLENGKTINESRLEISRAIVTFEIAIGEAERIYGEAVDLGVSPLSEGRFGITKKFPAGIISGITPFNFPVNLAAHKIAPAIATGCPIIIKPASATPITMLMLAEIIEETNLPKGAFSVVPCDRHTGQQLVEDDRINVLSFTGSPQVGWKMKKESGKKKVVLELGGNAGLIIDKDVEDWDWVISRSLMGAYYQAGQTCISVQRIYVHNDIYDEFKERFTKAIESYVPGDPREENTMIGSIIDQKNRDRLGEWIEEAVKSGANLLAGGDGEGTILNPTLLENVPKTCTLGQEEAFGAVSSLENFSDIDEAIQKVNDSKFGLQVGIFSKNIDNIMKVFNEVECGGVIQNDVPSFRADAMPYGGVKDSGLGREGIKYAMADMMEEKILVIKN